MSERPDEDSKTEEPTEKRIQDALDKGNVPFSRETTILTSTLGIFAAFAFFAGEGVHGIATMLMELIAQSDSTRFSDGAEVTERLVSIVFKVLIALAPALVTLALFGLAGSLFQNWPAIKLDRIQPKLSKISLKEGAKRMLGRKGLMEFAKTVLKFAIVATAAAVIISSDMDHILLAVLGEPEQLPHHMSAMITKLLAVVCVSILLLSVIDLLWSRHVWHRDLKMTRQEVKDDQKQTDGDPLIKVRQLSLARGRQRNLMLQSVPEATLIVVNPTHFSVALKYDAETDAAPVVVAKGQDLIALKIREIGQANGIPIFENKPLARGLYAGADVGQLIPEEFYRAVAELISYINRLN